MSQPELISVTGLVAATDYAAALFSIDNPGNLNRSKVFLYSGLVDTVVKPGVVKKLEEYYRHYIKTASSVGTLYNVSSEHAMITAGFGSACSTLSSPYINNCGVDLAGEILSFILDAPLKPSVAFDPASLSTFSQAKYIPGYPAVQPLEISLSEAVWAYIPQYCTSNQGCRVHVVFHGCLQTVDLIGMDYITKTGYLGYAEANNIIILFPQAVASDLNPKGCFDWFGYSGADFATKAGLQMATIHNMMKTLTL
jgi:hypothetical protein